MEWFVGIVFAGLLAAYIVLLRRIAQQEQRIAELRNQQSALADRWRKLSADAIERFVPERAAMISVQILNPAALAAQESPLARPLGSVAPELIRGIVYRKAADILRGELAGRGVEAEVRVHGLV